MKKLLIAGLILVMSQTIFAGVGEVRRMTPAEATARVERSATFKEIEKARSEGKDITADPKLMEKITKILDLSLDGVTKLSTSENMSLIRLLNISSKEVLSEVARLSSIAKDSSSTAQEKDMAKKSIELLVKASHNIKSLAVNSEQAQKQKEALTQLIEISNKISSLNFGTSSKSFIEKYEKALLEGKTVDEAIRTASNNKFGEKELRECE